MPPSVLILTLNEETNLAECISSVSWSSDIVILDSFSLDRTLEIGEKAGARIIQRHFDNWSSHQNWAVKNIKFRNPWVFYIDADERCDKDFAKELCSLDGMSEGFSAFRVRRKDHFMGRWLKRAQLYPTWITRVFRPEKISYERLVNPVAVVDGPVGELQGHLMHYPFSHGIKHWFARHNDYSNMEAEDKLRELKESGSWRQTFSHDPTVRRKALKRFAYSLPCRPWLMLFYLLFVRGAFLDGIPGIYYAHMRASYELMIDLKVRELKRKRENLSI